MEWLVKMVDWLLRETWWRRYYNRITLDEKTTWGGRCLVCDAGTPSNKSIRCDIIHNRECPCKGNQCLKYKPVEEKARRYDEALEKAKDIELR